MSVRSFAGDPSAIAYIGTYPPRRCGIATFTSDLVSAVGLAMPTTAGHVIAVSDRPAGYEYPLEVAHSIQQDSLESYDRAAEALNQSGTDLVCLQHEFGIFGGPHGSWLLRLLERIRQPIIATLHTVLEEPLALQRSVVDAIAKHASKLVVMSAKGRDLLLRNYDVPEEKVCLIPHGVPIPDEAAGMEMRERLNLQSAKVLLTFGLLSEDKGIEYVIRAMPEILKRHPDAHYLVVGATHPNVVAARGEAYRESLMQLARSIGVDEHVTFHNRFVEREELLSYLSMSDVYITPYLKTEQVTSGTLSYAIGAGCAVVSSPYWHAQELLADGRGVLTPPRDDAAIARAVTNLLSDDAWRQNIRASAKRLAETMTWPAVGRRYADLMRTVLAARRAPLFAVGEVRDRSADDRFLSPSMLHLRRLTDSTGLLQHSRYGVPRYGEGYCLDDNARALILLSTWRGNQEVGDERVSLMISRYLAFIEHAFDSRSQSFRNFLSFDHRWVDDDRSLEDPHGRALWALGTASSFLRDANYRRLARELFLDAMSGALGFTHLRAKAFALLGVVTFQTAHNDPRVAEIGAKLAADLTDRLDATRTPDWRWFEDYLSYANATLAHALLAAGRVMRNERYLRSALDSLEWLIGVQTSAGGLFEPVGSARRHRRGEEKPVFDQQPIEAAATVAACQEAYRVTREPAWHDLAHWAFEWFRGANPSGTPVADPITGACYDGVTPEGLNHNQGAESTLAYLQAAADLGYTWTDDLQGDLSVQGVAKR